MHKDGSLTMGTINHIPWNCWNSTGEHTQRERERERERESYTILNGFIVRHNR